MYKVIKPIPGYAYFGGELVNSFSPSEGASLLNAGYVIVLPDTEGDDDIKVGLPSDIPYRNILIANGYNDIEDLPASAAELAECLNGELSIGRCRYLYKYLKENG